MTEKEKDRVRQARRRERMLADRRPLTGVVDRVLIESVAFELARTPLPPEGLQAAAVPVGRTLMTALRILVRREGYNAAASKVALKSRLAKRPEHDDVSHIPSLHPDAGMSLQERTRQRQDELMSSI